ncbi:hypothetical protein BJ170DRAFT_249338 [Xylariales sp. AK1849]|nr:hypothetical protein BJ170DRAFT_249338 [Xylariales sp. AK1849]
MALKSIVKANEIASLEDRLQRTHATLTLQICAISSEYHHTLYKQYQALQATSKEHHVQQVGQLREIKQLLDIIKDRNNALEKDDQVENHDADHPNNNTKPEERKKATRAYQSTDIKTLEERMETLSRATDDIAFGLRVIDSLTFASRPLRHESIPEAHGRTFRWAFRTQEDRGTGTDRLTRWLTTGNGIFWVSGKPGSGKSTFMKYVADSEETLLALRQWASPGAAVIATHYFWVHGTRM